MQSLILQPWTTIHRIAGGSFDTFTQDAEDWLDVSGYADVVLWLDVSDITPIDATIQFSFQTAPNAEDTFFSQIAPTVTLTPSPFPQIIKSIRGNTPLGQLLRWQMSLFDNPSSAPSWGATFRVRAVPYRQSFFGPLAIPGCALWLRSDLGITLSSATTVQGWLDQSASQDPGKSLAQSTGSAQPGYQTNDQLYNGNPSLLFASSSSNFMTSSSWATVLAPPCTWICVAHNSSIGTSQQYLLDGDDTTFGQIITYTPSSTTPNVAVTVGGSTISANLALPGWTVPTALLAEVNGSSSAIYFNNFSTAAASGTLGSTGFKSMTLGSHSQAFGGGNYWDGRVAELMAFNRILSSTEKARLRNYLNGRYGFGMA
jgi:hypothetical protein